MERGEGGLRMRLPAAGLSSQKIACWADVSSFQVAALNRPKLVLFESLYVDTGFGSGEPDAHSAHTKHDHCRNDPGDNRAADNESVSEHLADAMRHDDHTRPGREMRKDKEHGEPIMRHEADVPRVLDQPGWRARGEAPPGVDAEIRPCENED